ncbi:MAG: Hsp20/alpha crystallin family protein [Erysipelotrichaceae bacterium]|nr:Hsp20/alpha crystallin family protein [Erysipelotrichaceae bacterium]
MKLVPRNNSGYGLDLFDDLFDFPVFKPLSNHDIMKTDIKEFDDNYSLAMDLPGFAKEDIKVELDKGYLTITAEKNTNNEEKDKKGNIIHQERYCGKCSRSFYVGDGIKENDIKAAYQDGILTLSIPKEVKKEEPKRLINIE